MTKNAKPTLWQKTALEIEATVLEAKDPATSTVRLQRIKKELDRKLLEIGTALYKRKYANNPIEEDQMISAMMMGYETAFQKYDPKNKTRSDFLTYAWVGMRNAMLHEVVKAFQLTTTAQKHLLYNETKYRKEARKKYPDIEEDDIDRLVAKKLLQYRTKTGNQIVSDFDNALNQVQTYKQKTTAARNTLSLNNTQSKEAGSAEFIDTLVDDNIPPIEDYASEPQYRDIVLAATRNAFEKLNERERIILAQRLPFCAAEHDDHVSDAAYASLESLSEIFNVSRERIRQISVKAQEKVRRSIAVELQDKGLTEIFGMDTRHLGAIAFNKEPPKNPIGSTFSATGNTPFRIEDFVSLVPEEEEPAVLAI